MTTTQCWTATGSAAFLIAALPMIAAAAPAILPDDIDRQLDALAETYVGLVLEIAEHDPDLIVSYYGPTERREQARLRTRGLEELGAAAADGAAVAAGLAVEAATLPGRRRAFLQMQLLALSERTKMLAGRFRPFFEEIELLYGTTLPQRDVRPDILSVHARIDGIMPGEGPLAKRIEAFRKRFVIPSERLEAVIGAAVAECRKRTRAVLELPRESLNFRFVSDVPWLTFNEFHDDGTTTISINTDLPIRIDRAIDVGCHDGYPGHHVSNVLKLRELVEGRGWAEFTVQTLYGPQTILEEGVATYGVDHIFPPAERLAFERDVLFGLAGLDRAQAYRYLELTALMAELAIADFEGARRYLDGDWTARQTVRWLVDYRLVSLAAARQRLQVFETYRSFIAAGYIGERLVRGYVAEREKERDVPATWTVLRDLLVAPVIPADLAR